jgi:hypothetical protein
MTLVPRDAYVTRDTGTLDSRRVQGNAGAHDTGTGGRRHVEVNAVALGGALIRRA